MQLNICELDFMRCKSGRLSIVHFLCFRRVGENMPDSQSTEQLPKLRPNYSRLLEAILYLIQQAERRGMAVTQYDIAKSIFLADVRHLENYGRPVTFGNYVAMEHGPVPTEAYDMLKPFYDWKRLGMDSAPWHADAIGNSLHFRLADREPNLKVLSQTDVSALEESLGLVKSLQFGGTREYTHKHPAYLAAWQDGVARRSFPMDYRLIANDSALAEDVAYMSKHM